MCMKWEWDDTLGIGVSVYVHGRWWKGYSEHIELMSSDAVSVPKIKLIKFSHESSGLWK